DFATSCASLGITIVVAFAGATIMRTARTHVTQYTVRGFNRESPFFSVGAGTPPLPYTRASARSEPGSGGTWESYSAKPSRELREFRAAGSAQCVNHGGQLTQITDRRVGHDCQFVLDRWRDRSASHRRGEVHRAHAAALRAVHVGIEVVADENDLVVRDAESSAQFFEDRRHRFAVAMLVREHHRIERAPDAEGVENLA